MKIALFLTAVFAFAWAEDFRCETGVPYRENDCNYCFCTPDQDMGCTLMFCDGNEKLKNCEVGTTYQKDCNQCWCVKDKGTICTNYDCE